MKVADNAMAQRATLRGNVICTFLMLFESSSDTMFTHS